MYRRFISTMLLASLYATTAGLARAPQEPGPSTSREEAALDARAKGLFSQGDWEDAIPVLEELASLQAERLGEDSPRLGSTYYNIGDSYRRLQRPGPAIEYLCKGLEILERAYPDRKTGAGVTRYYIAEMYEASGELEEAARWYSEALVDLIQGLPKADKSLQATFVVAARANQGAGLHDDAMEIYLRALELYGDDPGAFPTGITAAMHDYARASRDGGRPVQALLLFLASSSILEARLGKDHSHIADLRWDLGALFEQQGQYPEAAENFGAALEIYDLQGRRDEQTVGLRSNYARLLAGLYRFEDSRPAFEQAIDDAARLGMDEKFISSIKDDYILSFMRGYQFPTVREALDRFITEDSSDGDRLLFAAYLVQAGEYGSARRVLEPLREAFEAEGGSTEQLEMTLDLLATCHRNAGDHPLAREMRDRAGDLAARRLGEENGHVLHRRAIAAEEDGDQEAAADLLQQAAEALMRDEELTPILGAQIAERMARNLVELGPEHHEAAIANMESALHIRERLYGRKSPLYAATLFNFARTFQDVGKPDEAHSRFLEACSIMHEYTRNVLPLLSMPEQDSLIRFMVNPYVMAAFASTGDIARRAAIYNYAASWKGLLFEATRRRARLSQLEQDPALRPDLYRLRQVEADIARHYRTPSHQSETEQQWEAIYTELTSERERIERRLLAENADLVEDPFASGNAVEVLREAMVSGHVLVDLYRVAGLGGGETTYQAVIKAPSIPLQIVPIGDAASIEPLVERWHARVAEGDSATAEFERLREEVWRPISAAIPETVRAVWVAADGSLSLLPWQLFPLDPSRQVSTIPSTRELVRRLASTTRPRFRRDDTFLWVQETASDGSKSESVRRLEELRQILSDRLERRFSLTRRDTVLVDKDELLRLLSENRAAFIAAHGSFLPRSSMALLDLRIDVQHQELPESVGDSADRSPYVQSGIFLGGSRRGAEGIVLASDLLRARLDRCELVILAGCDSGQGTAIDGQGLLGLHSALMASGVRWSLVSLWKVPRESTELLFHEFLRQLLEERRGVPQALRLAQEHVRTVEGGRFEATRHWAGWVVVGG